MRINYYYDDNYIALQFSYNKKLLDLIKRFIKGKFRFWYARRKMWVFPIELKRQIENVLNIFVLGNKCIINKERHTIFLKNDYIYPKNYNEYIYNSEFLKSLTFLTKEQKEGATYLSSNLRFALFDDTGLGKTLQFLSAGINQMQNKYGMFEKLIIVCPWSARQSIFDDLSNFFPSYVNRTCVVKGNQEEKIKQILSDWDILIITYENFIREVYSDLIYEKVIKLKRKDNLDKQPFAIIFDESHRMKNPQSMKFKVACRFCKIAKVVWLSTGTPITNGLEDIWTQAYLLDDRIFGEDYFEFLFRNFKMGSDFSFYDFAKEDKKKRIVLNEKKIKEKIESFSIRRLKKDFIELPSKSHVIKYCKPSKEQIKINEKLLNNFEPGDLMKLIQNSSNSKLLNGKEMGGKFDYLKEFLPFLINEKGYKKIILFTNFVNNFPMFMERFKNYNPVCVYGKVTDKEREKAIKAFKEKEDCKLLIANPKSCQEGMNLTISNCIIYYDKTFEQNVIMQSQDRFYRRGQDKECIIYHLTTLFEDKDTSIDCVINMDLLNKMKHKEEYISGAENTFLTKKQIYDIIKERRDKSCKTKKK